MGKVGDLRRVLDTSDLYRPGGLVDSDAKRDKFIPRRIKAFDFADVHVLVMYAIHLLRERTSPLALSKARCPLLAR